MPKVGAGGTAVKMGVASQHPSRNNWKEQELNNGHCVAKQKIWFWERVRL